MVTAAEPRLVHLTQSDLDELKSSRRVVPVADLEGT